MLGVPRRHTAYLATSNALRHAHHFSPKNLASVPNILPLNLPAIGNMSVSTSNGAASTVEVDCDVGRNADIQNKEARTSAMNTEMHDMHNAHQRAISNMSVSTSNGAAT
jgi:hypothetical protein